MNLKILLNHPLILLSAILLYFSCQTENREIKKAKEQKVFNTDTVYDENGMMKVRFIPKYKFNDFPADTILFKHATSLDLSSHADAKRFLTRLKEGFLKGINFAGHFNFVFWGCGTGCTTGLLVDIKTGKIYSGPPFIFQNISFIPSSRMVIVNPPDETGYFSPNITDDIPEIYILNNDFCFQKIQ